jgi:hypothetical protein
MGGIASNASVKSNESLIPGPGGGAGFPAQRRMHPFIAVALGVNNHWHKWLFLCRTLSVLPELQFGIPLLFGLAGRLFGLPYSDASLTLAEMLLVALWVSLYLTLKYVPEHCLLNSAKCAVSGYVSFFLMDCLMTRW